MAGYDVPSFFEYIREGKVVKGDEIELSGAEWDEYDNDFKGEFEGNKAILVFEAGMLKIVGIKTAFLGGVTNKPEEKDVKPFESEHDKTQAQGGDPEKAAKDVKDSVESGNRKTDTKQVKESGGMDEVADDPEKQKEDAAEAAANCAECGKQFGTNKQINVCADHQGLEAMNESAEAAHKAIKAAQSGSRLTSSSDTSTKSNTEVSKPASELGAEKFKTEDQADDQADDPKKITPEAPTVEPEATKAQGSGRVSEGKSLKDYLRASKIVEKWSTSYETPKSKRGMFDGKSKEELDTELSTLKKTGPHKEGSAEFTKEKELMFALRAKNHFGGVKENANSESDANRELELASDSDREEPDSYFAHNEKTENAKKAKKVKESAIDIAKRIIASVKGGNHPHDAKNSGTTKEEKGKSFDYNKLVDKTPVIDAAREGDATEEKTREEKRGLDKTYEDKLDVPAKVIEQIDTRLKELKDAQQSFDNKENAGGSVKQNAIDALERIKEHLGKRNKKEFYEAQVFYGTLWSEITHLLPSALINFLATGREKA